MYRERESGRATERIPNVREILHSAPKEEWSVGSESARALTPSIRSILKICTIYWMRTLSRARARLNNAYCIHLRFGLSFVVLLMLFCPYIPQNVYQYRPLVVYIKSCAHTHRYIHTCSVYAVCSSRARDTHISRQQANKRTNERMIVHTCPKTSITAHLFANTQNAK